MKMLNVILNFYGYYILNKQFLILRHNKRLYSKDQESIQSSIISDKGHHMGK